ncbi:MAG: cytochrome c oxidase assembly protein [Gaiellales bacterium]
MAAEILAPVLAAAPAGTPSLSSPWRLDPLLLLLAGLAIALFLQGWLRLRRRGRAEHASGWRPVLFVLGVAAAVVPLVSPIDELSDSYLLSAHMLEHVLLADVSPALMLLAVRGPLVFFLLPPAVLRPLARGHRLRAVLGWLMRPAVAVTAWAVVMTAWHIPAAYDAVLHRPWLHDLEHLSFVVVGTLVWSQLIDPTRRLTIRTRLKTALAYLVVGQTLSDALLFSFQSYYPAYAHQAHRVLGLSPLTDQRAAGAVMMAEQWLATGTCIVILLLALRRTPTRPQATPARSELA